MQSRSSSSNFSLQDAFHMVDADFFSNKKVIILRCMLHSYANNIPSTVNMFLG